jgi:hypothetical protein
MRSGWTYAGASVIGTSHLTSPAGVCQDAHICRYFPEKDVMLCIASDGAGSALHSETGSRIVCDLISQAVEIAPPAILHTSDFAKSALFSIQEALQQEATLHEARLRDYACTLLAVIVGKEQVTFWQIGDGAICFRLAGNDNYEYAFWPVKGEYANVTQFVTDANAQEELQFDSARLTVEEVAVFSDGLERLALNFKTEEVHQAFLKGLFPYLNRQPSEHSQVIEEQIAGFLSSGRVNERTDDDKTLILASRGDKDAA